jgi:hypothetical protein
MKTLWISLSLCALTLGLFATPAQVLLIRHAEKPKSGPGLSKAGLERAAAFVPFFTIDPLPGVNQPVAIFAQTSSKNHKSTRPVQTVAPLSNALGIPLFARYTWGSYESMVSDIMSDSDYDGKTVLICWEHSRLGDIAAAFGVSPKPTYPSGVYDRLWVIDIDGNKEASFHDLPQQLMYGDTAT